VLEAALFPQLDLPDPPDGFPYQVRHGDGYQIGFTRGYPFASVVVRRLAEDETATRVAEVRALLAGLGFERAAWVVSEAAEPDGVASRLRAEGLVPWEEKAEGLEARSRQMTLVTEPAPAPEGAVARQAESEEEFVTAFRVAQEAFDLSEQARRTFEERQAELWRWQQRFPDFRTFIAFVDGEIVGNASTVFGANAAYMMGGSVRADSRGRGAYRALVRARWDAAVERGIPALTVTAGSMSAPVLERLGFVTACWVDTLSDRFS
jgi:ribosomal protein S18 acetylase RimI-like enzyme